PPILQCPNGCLFCQPCRQSLRVLNCPKCREPLPKKKDIRCHSMEQVANTLQFPCKFADAGCTLKAGLKDIPFHSKRCRFRPYRCPISSKCEWLGSEEQIVGHLIDFHKIIVYDGSDCGTFKLNPFADSPQMNKTCVRLLLFLDRYFLYVVTKNINNLYNC